MDPQAAWNEMLEAVHQRDWEAAELRAEALLEWMRKGGVPPQTAAFPMRPQWNRTMAEFGCLMAQQFVKQSQRRRERKG
jgi:hypothetical protein